MAVAGRTFNSGWDQDIVARVSDSDSVSYLTESAPLSASELLKNNMG